MKCSLLQKLDKINDKYGVWIFYAALILMTIGGYWFWFTGVPPRIPWIFAYCTLLGSKFCYLRIVLFLRRQPIYSILSLLLLAFFYYQDNYIIKDKFIYLSLLTIIAAREADSRRTLVLYIGTCVSVVITAVFFYHLGWSADIQKHTFSLAGHSWGFSNPNQFGLLLVSLTLAAIAWWQPKEEWKICMICIAGACLTGLITLCATGALSLLAFPVVHYIIKKYPLYPLLWGAMPIVCFILSIGLALYYGPSMGSTTFESRFSMSYMQYLETGIHWVGQDCHLIPLKTVLREGIDAICLDNTYLRIPLEFGIIPSFIIYGLLCYNIYLIAQKHSPILLAIALCFLLIGFCETASLRSRINFSLLFSFINFAAGPTGPTARNR